MVTHLKFCILIHDGQTKDILWANPAACEMLGFTLEELRPLKAPDMSGAASRYRRSVGRRWLQRAMDEGISRTEWKYKNKAGTEFLTEATAIRLDLAERQVVMVQFRNMEHEEELKTDLQRTESRLRAFIGSMGDGIIVVDESGLISYASESSELQLGCSTEELVGSRFTDLWTAESYAEQGSFLAGPAMAPQTGTIRLERQFPDGTRRWFGVSCQPIDLEQDLRGALLYLHDITDRIHDEEEQQRNQDHMNYLARHNVMGDMAMALAHEFGQPLAAATNFISGLQRRLVSGQGSYEALSYGLDNAQRQIERANELLNSLKSYVGKLESSEQIVDLNKIVRESLYFIRLSAERARTEVRLELHPGPILVRCEKVLVGQVILNLSRNAIQEMEAFPADERTITIATTPVEDTGEFEVRDRGRGLAHFPDGRIFDGAFTTKESGSGIGLALSHRIITRLGGTISADELQPRGSSFSFRLPRVEEPVEAGASTQVIRAVENAVD